MNRTDHKHTVKPGARRGTGKSGSLPANARGPSARALRMGLAPGTLSRSSTPKPR